MRNIIVIVGSKSDFKQCGSGLKFFKGIPDITVHVVYVCSVHRNLLLLLGLLKKLTYNGGTNVVIAGAGWANHLTGCADAFLRYEFRNDTIPVVGVAFEDTTDKDEEVRKRHTQAAILSMTEVPGTQVVYQDGAGIFVGSDGFLRACRFAVSGDLPKIKLPDPNAKPSLELTLDEAIALASE